MSAPRLSLSDAVAAVIRRTDGRYVMQLRDDKPGIWFPAAWGCFGGSVDAGESDMDALRRELQEELELELREAFEISRFTYDLTPSGLGRYYRAYYLVQVDDAQFASLVLHEGQRMQAFTYHELSSGLPVTPYDALAIHLFHGRASGVIVT